MHRLRASASAGLSIFRLYIPMSLRWYQRRTDRLVLQCVYEL